MTFVLNWVKAPLNFIGFMKIHRALYFFVSQKLLQKQLFRAKLMLKTP